MTTKVQKWGNSLALRIPKPFAEEAGLEPDSVVDIAVKDGTLVIKPSPKRRRSLKELLVDITDENRHEETEWGEPVGGEIW